MTEHASDCAVHNGPARKSDKCDCGTVMTPEDRALEIMRMSVNYDGRIKIIAQALCDHGNEKLGAAIERLEARIKNLQSHQSDIDAAEIQRLGYVGSLRVSIEHLHALKDEPTKDTDMPVVTFTRPCESCGERFATERPNELYCPSHRALKDPQTKPEER